MTVVTDHELRVCSLCKRPTDPLPKDEAIIDGGNDRIRAGLTEQNQMPNNEDVESNAVLSPEPKPNPNSQPTSQATSTPNPIPDPQVRNVIAENHFGLLRWLMPRYLNPRIERIIYWRNGGKSAFAFMCGLMLLGATKFYSIISVVSHLCLALLTSIFLCKICKIIFRRRFLVKEWPTCDNLEARVIKAINGMVDLIAEVRDIVFVKDLFKTFKYCFLLELWKIIGDFMNGYTLVVSIYIGLFTIPKICELMVPKLLKLIDMSIIYLQSRLAYLDTDE